jgi:circadian clock protein KaiC
LSIERLKTGNPNLDEVLLGGFPINTINVVMGAPGSGKTILAEQLVFSNATPEAPALYLTTLSEPLDKFIQHGQSYGFFD